MKLKYIVKKNGVEIYSNIVESTEEGDAWVEANKHLFGTQDFSTNLEGVDSRGLSISDAASTSEEPIMVDGVQQGTRTMYHFAKNWTVEYSDVTSELQQALVNEQSLKHLADTDWYVIRKMESNVDIPSEVLTSRAAARAAIVR